MALEFYYQLSANGFGVGDKVDKVNTYTGDGSTTTRTIVNGSSTTSGRTAQVDTQYYSQALGGLSFPSGSQFTLSTAPPLNSQILLPGLNAVTFTAFDSIGVPSVTAPSNVDDADVYLIDADPTSISTTKYEAVPGTAGIAILFTNLVTAAGAQTFWTQLACTNSSGTALTYAATAATLYLDNITAFGTLSASAAIGSTTFTCSTASAFTIGDFIMVNPGGGNQDNPRITNISGTTITHTGFNFAHSAGENVFHNGYHVKAKVTIPVNALSGQAGTLINLGLRYSAIKISRL